MIFETERLTVKLARSSTETIDNYHRLWNSSEVMKFVGFPEGLGIAKSEIKKQLTEDAKTKSSSSYDRSLAVYEIESGNFVGECKLGSFNKELISETDVKFLPEYWGKGYGNEIKQALCHFLFSRTKCNIFSATPNKLNLASQKMQKYCGGEIISEGLYEAPKDGKIKRSDVEYYLYHITREAFYQKFPELV